MRKLTKLYTTIVFMACFVACKKDKSNTDMVDFNKVLKIELKGKSAILLGDTAKVTAKMLWKQPDKDTLAFEYEWRMGDTLVSTSRNLQYVIPKTGVKWFYLYVVEKATGITTRQQIQISVNSPYKAGWLLLAEQGGNTELSFIRRDKYVDDNKVTTYKYKAYPNVFNMLYPDATIGQQPIRIIADIFPNDNDDEILILQKNNASVFLSGNDFSKVSNLSDEFAGTGLTNNPQPVDYKFTVSVAHVLMDNGAIYWKPYQQMSNVIHTGSFMNTPLEYDKGGAVVKNFIDVDFYNSSMISFYDTKNSRLLGLWTGKTISPWAGYKLPFGYSGGLPAGFVDLKDQKGYKYVYGSDYAGGKAFMMLIKKESSGEIFMQNFSFDNYVSSLNIYDMKQESFAGNGLVNDETVYYRLRNGSYMFMGVGSTLYFYDINTRQNKRYHDFGNSKIVSITSDPTGGEIGVALENGSFYICSTDINVLGAAAPGTDGGILFKQEGLGKLINVVWKWGGWTNYAVKTYP